MKKLELTQMESVEGGNQPYSCGQAVMMGMMLGGMFGPEGAIIGAFAVIAGPNCNH